MGAHRFTPKKWILKGRLSAHLRQRAGRRRRRSGTWTVADDGIGARITPAASTTLSGTEFDLRSAKR